MGSEQREALLKHKERVYNDEKCPGCNIDKIKNSNHDIPYKHLFFVFLVALAAALPISSLFPFVYFMVRDFHIAKREEDIGYYAGFVGASFMFGRFLTSVVWGIIADRYGRKPVIMFGTIAVVIFNTLFGVSTNFWMAISTRFLLGALCGILGAVRAYSLEICRKEYQALAISTVNTAWGVGLVIGPAIGGLFSEPAKKFPKLIYEDSLFGRFPYFLPCLLISIFSLGVTFICIWLPETLHFHTNNDEKHEEVCHPVKASTSGSDMEETLQESEKTCSTSTSKPRLLTNWPLMSALTLYCVVQVHDMAYGEIFPLWAVKPEKNGGLGYSSSDVGEVLSVSGIGLLFFQLFFYPRLERTFGSVALARIGMICSITLLSSYPFLTNLHGVSLKLLVNFASFLMNVISVSISTGLVLLQNRAVSQEQRGAANGISMCAVSLFKAVGPAAGGALFSWCQKRRNASFFPGDHMIFFILNVIELIAMIMTFKPFLDVPHNNSF